MTQSTMFSETLRGLFARYAEDIVSGDIDRWITMWDEDGVQMPPGTPERRGKATILAKVKQDLQTVRYVAFAGELVEAFAFGEFAVARGGYRYSFVRTGSEERHDRVGKYLTVFRRQPDGSWKIFRDCFNLDAPA